MKGDHPDVSIRLPTASPRLNQILVHDASVTGIRSVNDPVFGEDGNAVLMLSLFGLPERVSAADVRRYVERLLALLNILLHGPEGTVKLTEMAGRGGAELAARSR